MATVEFYRLSEIGDSLLKFAVIAARYNGKWIFCRHKERDTYEIPGGHREINENITDTAKRELYEETGALDFSLAPVCVYAVNRGEIPSYGMFFTAEVKTLGKLPHDMEMAEIIFSDTLPEKLTYPLIQPQLFEKVNTYHKLLNNLAPCSLFCYSCPAFKNGVVPEYAKKLSRYFDGYYEFNLKNLPVQYISYADEIKTFTDRLDKFSNPSCNGCRDNTHGNCCIKSCFILDCTQKHDVSFCCECSKFPCDKYATGVFNETVLSRIKRGNERIREVGAEQFFEEEKRMSHYEDWRQDYDYTGKRAFDTSPI